MDDTVTETPESSAPPVAEEQPTAQAAGATQGTSATQAQPGQASVEKLSIMGTEIEKSKVPPELMEKVDAWNKAFTSKSQEASELRKKAEALDRLSGHPAFQKWYHDQLNGTQSAEPKEDPLKLTPERQAELLSDPGKMQEYFTNLARAVNQDVLSAAQQAQYEARVLRQEQNVSTLADKYKDFDDLNNSGKIEEIVAKYSGKGVDIDLEDAYWLAKRPYLESEASIKAHERVQEKARGATLPPSSATANGTKVLSGKGMPLEEKMRLAFEHSLRGEKIKFSD